MTERWSDERMEEIIGALLRVGVILAATVVALGGVVYLVRHGGEHPNYSAFHGEPPEYIHPGAILRGVLAGRGRAIIQLGLLILIATPVARVAFSAVGFAKQRDRTYVAITLFVLGVLIYSLYGGV